MSNILIKEDRSTPPAFGTPVSSREKWSWASDSEEGVFQLVSKYDLNIDGTYQRDLVSEDKVRAIARNWDWRLFSALSVIVRRDGSYWVYDGGHRARASFLRDDVDLLPCLVFECESIEEEAKAFVGANTMSSAVSAYHKYRGALRAKEPQALAVCGVLEKYGYKAAKASSGGYLFSALGTLQKLLLEDFSLAEQVFALCAEFAQGDQIPGDVLIGVFTCAKKLAGKVDIMKGTLYEKLKSAGVEGIHVAIRRERHICGKGGAKVSAKAVLDILNKGKKRRISFPNGSD